MRFSQVGLALGIGLMVVTSGCGPMARNMTLPAAVAGLSSGNDDPFHEIRAVADKIWNAMGGDGFESSLQIVSGRPNAKPKYTFLNVSVDPSDPSLQLFRAGTYAMAPQKMTVQVTFVGSTNPSRWANKPGVGAAIQAIKASIKETYGNPVTSLAISEQAHGPKYAFVAFSANQPEKTTFDWAFVGTYSVSTKKVEVPFGFGQGHGENTYVKTAKK